MSRRSLRWDTSGDTPERVALRLSSLSKIAKIEGRGGFLDMAETVMRESQARAPLDTGALEEAHYVNIVRDNLVSGFFQVEIGVSPVVGEEGWDYTIIMHEGIGGEPYNLGPRSQAKNTGTPHVGRGVGWKYLERAYEAVYRTKLREVNARIKRGLATVAIR